MSGKRKSTDDNDRPRRDVKPTKRYFQEQAFRNGIVEQTVDSECGLDQPGGSTARKESALERLGTEAWHDVLRPCLDLNWFVYKQSALETTYIFHCGHKNTKAAYEALEEGVTKFTGYSALGYQYKLDGKNGEKILNRAREALHQKPAPAPAAPVALVAPAPAASAAPAPVATVVAPAPAVPEAVPAPTVAVVVKREPDAATSVHHPPATIEVVHSTHSASSTKNKSLETRICELEVKLGGSTHEEDTWLQRLDQLETAIGVNVVGSLLARVERLEEELA